MGRSITESQHIRIERLRCEGRLCAGPSRTECLTRATVVVTQEAWTYAIGEGKSHVSKLRMCPRHARQFPVGYQGVNFRVTGVVSAP